MVLRHRKAAGAAVCDWFLWAFLLRGLRSLYITIGHVNTPSLASRSVRTQLSLSRALHDEMYHITPSRRNESTLFGQHVTPNTHKEAHRTPHEIGHVLPKPSRKKLSPRRLHFTQEPTSNLSVDSQPQPNNEEFPEGEKEKRKHTNTQSPLLPSSNETCAMASATRAGLFSSSPCSLHWRAKPAVIFVGVKNGAMALTLTPRFRAAVCDERRSPSTPCFEAQ